MAEYLLDDLLFSPEAKRELAELRNELASFKEAILSVNNANTASSAQYQEIQEKLVALEGAIKRLTEAKQRHIAAQKSYHQMQKEQDEASARELARMNEYYVRQERLTALKAADKQAERERNAAKREALALERQRIREQERAEREAIRAAERMAREAAREQAREERRKANTAQARVDRQALNAVERLSAILASEHTTELQKLDAQMQLNIRSAMKYVAAGDTQNEEYLKLVASTKKLSEESIKLQQASGMMERGLSRSYTSVFSLTQVMRELPNFAIDVRLGFMALSNNLPMLADDFQRLSRSIDSVTGQQLGFKGAMREMAKSLLSVNTIMVVAVTLMIMYGEEFVALFQGKVPVAEQALKNYTKALKDGNTEFSNAYREVFRLQVLMANIDEQYVTSKEVLDEYNSTLGDSIGKTDSLVEAQINLQNKAGDYIKVMGMMSYANEMLSIAVAKAARIEALRAKTTISLWERTVAFLSKTGLQLSGQYVDQTLDEIVEENRALKISRLEADLNKESEIIRDYYADMYKYAEEHGIDLLNNETKSGEDRRNEYIQQGTDILKQEKQFNEERLKATQRMRGLEDKMAQEGTEGLLNSYEDRNKAIEEYAENAYKVAQIDYELAKATADEKFRVETERINTTRERNARLYEAGKITAERFAELEQQYADASITLVKNRNIEHIEAHEELLNTNLSIYKAYFKQIRDLERDQYADEVKELEDFLLTQQKAIDRAYSAARSQINAPTFLGALTGYGDRGTGMNNASLERDRNAAQNKVIEEGIRKQIELTKEGSKERKKLQDELTTHLIKAEEQYKDDTLNLELETQKLRQDLMVDMANQTVELISSIWDAYYKSEMDKLKQRSDYFKDVEDERLRDVEDREKAGVITSKEAEEEKVRMQDYYKSVQDQIDKERAEKEREKFLWEQAAALAQVWINWGISVASPANMLALGALTPLYTALALLSTGTIAAQTIPMFAKGGTMDNDGLAIVGDGGRKEVIVTPDGKVMLTPDTPTLVNLERGTNIFPDADKFDIYSTMRGSRRVVQSSDDKLYNEIVGLRRDFRRKRVVNTTLPVLEQIKFGKNFNSHRSGI